MVSEQELWERCEKATGPDYALSQAIFAALGLVPNRADVGYPGYHYTASLDAAMALVLEGALVTMTGPAGKTYSVRVNEEVGLARSFALALCAAALKARAIKDTTSGGE